MFSLIRLTLFTRWGRYLIGGVLLCIAVLVAVAGLRPTIIHETTGKVSVLYDAVDQQSNAYVHNRLVLAGDNASYIFVRTDFTPAIADDDFQPGQLATVWYTQGNGENDIVALQLRSGSGVVTKYVTATYRNPNSMRTADLVLAGIAAALGLVLVVLGRMAPTLGAGGQAAPRTRPSAKPSGKSGAKVSTSAPTSAPAREMAFAPVGATASARSGGPASQRVSRPPAGQRVSQPLEDEATAKMPSPMPSQPPARQPHFSQPPAAYGQDPYAQSPAPFGQPSPASQHSQPIAPMTPFGQPQPSSQQMQQPYGQPQSEPSPYAQPTFGQADPYSQPLQPYGQPAPGQPHAPSGSPNPFSRPLQPFGQPQPDQGAHGPVPYGQPPFGQPNQYSQPFQQRDQPGYGTSDPYGQPRAPQGPQSPYGPTGQQDGSQQQPPRDPNDPSFWGQS